MPRPQQPQPPPPTTHRPLATPRADKLQKVAQMAVVRIMPMMSWRGESDTKTAHASTHMLHSGPSAQKKVVKDNPVLGRISLKYYLVCKA